jgi:hypothetical protein
MSSSTRRSRSDSRASELPAAGATSLPTTVGSSADPPAATHPAVWRNCPGPVVRPGRGAPPPADAKNTRFARVDRPRHTLRTRLGVRTSRVHGPGGRQRLPIGVADALRPEPVRPEVLASSVGVNADALFRIVRLLAAHGVFEIKDGRIAHTPASEILRTDHPQSMRAFVRVMGVPIMWSAYGELEHAMRTGHSAVEKAVPEGFFGYMAANPNVAGIFDEAMMAASHAQIPAILGSYDFSRFKRIGDIAGGRGHLLKALLEQQPGASGVLFELPHVIAEAKGKLPCRSSKRSLSDRPMSTSAYESPSPPTTVECTREFGSFLTSSSSSRSWHGAADFQSGSDLGSRSRQGDPGTG